MELNVSQAQWEEAAEKLHLSVNEVQARYEDAINNLGSQAIVVKKEDLSTSKSGDVSIPFEISLFDIVSLSGEVAYEENGGDWSVHYSVELKLIGITVLSIDETVTKEQAEFGFEVSAGVAKASVYLGVRDGSCFYVRGEACYWAITWQCADFDETIHCF